ncbi:MAG: Ig-like domain-containing protein [Bacteroidales bacterium]|nr:Ig-like domain-containing protein [Clostridium sp.]MCM1203927.1 Ig-like domain-containing protein [Bacteroidales bacterium]
MKRKHFKQIAILLLAAILVVGMGTVLSGSIRQVYAAGSKKMKLNHSSVTMQAGTERTLKITKNKPSGTVKWNSSNKKVASVSKKGVVTAKKKGTAVITAKKGEKSGV